MSVKNYNYLCIEDCIQNKANLDFRASLRVFQWNIRGMGSLTKFDVVKEFLDRYKERIDVIVIGETWIKEGCQNMYELNGYKAVFSCRRSSHGGLAMFVKEDLRLNLMEVKHMDGLHIIEADVQACGRSIHLIAVYRPPGYPFPSFLDIIDDKLSRTKKEQNVFVVGDVNVPTNLPADNVVREYSRMLASHNMKVTNTTVTRPASGNILDHVVGSVGLRSNLQNETIECDVSDHSMILSSVNFKLPRISQVLEKRIIDHSLLNQRFAIVLASLPSNLAANEKIKEISAKYNDILNASSKLVTIEVTTKGYCPWMSYDLWYLMRMKENLHKRSKAHPSDSHLKDLLKHVSKTLQDKKDKAKRDYYHNMIHNSSERNSWKLINEVMGRKPKDSQGISLKIDGETVSDCGRVANELNGFFCNVGVNLASKIDSDRNIWKFRSLPSCNLSLFLRPASLEEIVLLIKDLNVKKSPGPDGIPASVIKTHHLAFANILLGIFNEIISTGQYPESLKVARVVPVFKTGEATNLNNYRPISTLSALNKIVEKMIATRISAFLSENELISNVQYGFRRGSSTLTATNEVLEEIYGHLDNRRFSGALFLDLKKAFDTIDHELLLRKLEHYGIRGVPNRLLRSYLSNRQQFVSNNGFASDHRHIATGVPQGSILGPLLFLIFINDLPRVNLRGSIRLFADDTVLLYGNGDSAKIVDDIQADLQRLLEYFNSNLLSLNLEKTTYMFFHSAWRNVPPLPAVVVDNIEIQRVAVYKYLGLKLDSKVSWESHIDDLKQKIAPICGALWKMSSFVPRSWLLKIYYSMVHSRLQYLSALWGSARQVRIRELQSLQNRCLKIVFNLPRLYSTQLLYEDMRHSALPIRGLHAMQNISLTHNMINDPETHHNLELPTLDSGRPTSSTGDLRLTRPNTELGKRRFTYIGYKLHNQLPDPLKLMTSRQSFKQGLRNLLKSSVARFLAAVNF